MDSLNDLRTLSRPPLDVLGGLKKAIVDPIAKDFRDGYWTQRAVRARYPAADALLNFVPYVGIATNADDLQRSVIDSGRINPGDLAGLAVGAASTKLGLKGLSTVASGIPGRKASSVMVNGVGLPAAGYLNHYIDAQSAANQKYGNRPLHEIVKELSR